MKNKLFAFLNRTVNKIYEGTINCGYANGYVAVPPEHPLHGKSYNSVYGFFDIHGGLTFSESIKDIKADGYMEDTECIGFDSFDDIPKDYWVFGFDTIHCDDGPHHDRDWCIRETEDLKRQIEGF